MITLATAGIALALLPVLGGASFSDAVAQR